MQELFPDFNCNIMVLLPKKASGLDGEGNEYFDPVNTRPLNICNTDNRLIANAVRLRIEPTLDGHVSEIQRGFRRYARLAGGYSVVRMGGLLRMSSSP